MIRIEYLGETGNGTPCATCGGAKNVPRIRKKKIYGRVWEVGHPQDVSIDEFEKYMLTGLFRKV